ncbi:MAG: hypothetical protein R2864_11395 [Syntrophotaleaceae bacterium]
MSKRAETVYLQDYAKPAYLIDNVDLHFELGEDQTKVFSRLALRRQPGSPAVPLVLDGNALGLEQILLDGRPLAVGEYLLDEESLTVPLVPECFVLETSVVIAPQDNTALEGLYRSGSLFCTQCEAEGFRRISWFADRPDIMSRFTTTIIADRQRYPVLLSISRQPRLQESGTCGLSTGFLHSMPKGSRPGGSRTYQHVRRGAYGGHVGGSPELGAQQGTLVRYGNSGETTGDNAEVVGYAGVIIA